jgi:hypothetical protein
MYTNDKFLANQQTIDRSGPIYVDATWFIYALQEHTTFYSAPLLQEHVRA